MKDPFTEDTKAFWDSLPKGNFVGGYVDPKYVEKRVVPASNFVATLSVNVDNEKMSDKDFRQLVRNTLPIVIYDNADKRQKRREDIPQIEKTIRYFADYPENP